MVSQITSISAGPFDEGFAFGDYFLDPENQLISHKSGHHYRLRPKEFQLLLFFLNNRNKVINKSFLLEVLWNYDIYTHTNTLEVHLSSLRKKLEKFSSQRLIETVHGAGYRMIV
jgi:DNA-binding response OmpR family regulator